MSARSLFSRTSLALGTEKEVGKRRVGRREIDALHCSRNGVTLESIHTRWMEGRRVFSLSSHGNAVYSWSHAFMVQKVDRGFVIPTIVVVISSRNFSFAERSFITTERNMMVKPGVAKATSIFMEQLPGLW